MGIEYHPGLRGFDSFEVKLGDYLRGERASMGKSLLDVQRELRIRADYIAAIENADASVFPFTGLAAGYVRSYARYLGLDGDDVYRRFCDESGFTGVEMTEDFTPVRQKRRPEAAAAAKSQPAGEEAGRQPKAPSRPHVSDQVVIGNRFLKSNTSAMRMDLGASLRGLASVAVLAALVGGLGWGGWNLLQDLQRLGFAPLPTAPEVMVTAPDILAPAGPELAEAAEEGGSVTLASVYADQEIAPETFASRDGPISAIDPKSAGIYALPAPEPLSAPQVLLTSAPAPEGAEQAAASAEAPGDETAIAAAAPVSPNLVDVYATEDAWVRIRDGERKVLFTGILGPGERFTLPEGVQAPELRAGNAGAVYIVVGGAAFGPLGNGPAVAKKVKLTPDAVRAAWPAAPHIAAGQPAGSNLREASSGEQPAEPVVLSSN